MPAPREKLKVINTPIILQDDALFTIEAARQALGLPRWSIPNEIRKGRLRVSKACGRYYIRSAWLLEWIDKAEADRRGRRNAKSPTV